jgi:hypothetical protein
MSFAPERGNQKAHGSRKVSYAAKYKITVLLRDVGIGVIAGLSVGQGIFQQNFSLRKPAE